MYILSIILGFLIVIVSVLLMRNEFKKSLDLKVSKLGDFSDGEKRKIIEVIEELEEEINNLNRAFYEIVNDLEGKYSIHDKQIEMIEEKFKENLKIDEYKKFNNIKKNNENTIIEEINNDSIENQIIKMRAKNMSVNEIAKKLGVGVGEIKLLLNINKKSN